MNDSDQSTAAAPGPHRRPGDHSTPQPANGKPSLMARLRALLTNRSGSIREDLAEALESEGAGPALPGSFSANERALLQNVLKLGEVRVDDVMVPRADIEAVDAAGTMAELIARFRAAGHSRLPVYDDNLDQIVGFVHIKDALERISEMHNGKGANGEAAATGLPVRLRSAVLRQKIGSKDMVRKVLFVPPSMPVGDLLQQMQATRVHMAIVVDEYGGTDGLVTIEDLLEVVVGDIEDEHDEVEGPLASRIDDNTYVADARVELSELRDLIGPDFDPGAHVEDVDTLGGLVFELIDRVPVRGEVISKFRGFEFEILAADARRIRRVRIVRRKRPLRPRIEARPDGAGEGT